MIPTKKEINMASTPKPVRKVIKKMVNESKSFHEEKSGGLKQPTKNRMKEHASRLKESHDKGKPVFDKGKHVKALVNRKVVKENEERNEKMRNMK